MSNASIRYSKQIISRITIFPSDLSVIDFNIRYLLRIGRNPKNLFTTSDNLFELVSEKMGEQKLVEWTGTGKTDKIKIREKVLGAVENHRIDLSKIDDEKTFRRKGKRMLK